MTSRKMSEAALKRCRNVVITDLSTDERYRKKIEVFDPRVGEKPVAYCVTRNEIDTRRVLRGFMGKYRIPNEKVVYVDQKELGSVVSEE